jgi:hypothetical protein
LRFANPNGISRKSAKKQQRVSRKGAKAQRTTTGLTQRRKEQRRVSRKGAKARTSTTGLTQRRKEELQNIFFLQSTPPLWPSCPLSINSRRLVVVAFLTLHSAFLRLCAFARNPFAVFAAVLCAFAPLRETLLQFLRQFFAPLRLCANPFCSSL